MPAASEVVEKVATPDEFSAPVPRLVVPSRKVTVPVGVPAPEDADTVAVRVRLCPVVTVVADAASAVDVAAGVEPPPPEEEPCSRNVPEPSRSILPSPLMSYAPDNPIPVLSRIGSTGMTVPLWPTGVLWKVPSPLPGKRPLSRPGWKPRIAISALPSPVKSPTANDSNPSPLASCIGV
jgi:hypothetical protein